MLNTQRSTSFLLYLEGKIYTPAKYRKLFLKASKLDAQEIPEAPYFTLEQALDEDWLPWQPE
ncbi:DUF29 domain-containing protein [Leptothermofonsia sichuanensis]|uniref:DUF29 domain-containing protein n=1 Tax=Leptothermofonsia sichuanensis TaxID=2917832 RepID=UPI001EF09431